MDFLSAEILNFRWSTQPINVQDDQDRNSREITDVVCFTLGHIFFLPFLLLNVSFMQNVMVQHTWKLKTTKDQGLSPSIHERKLKSSLRASFFYYSDINHSENAKRKKNTQYLIGCFAFSYFGGEFMNRCVYEELDISSHILIPCTQSQPHLSWIQIKVR